MRWRLQQSYPKIDIAHEAECFLEGRLVQIAIERNHDVPDWAWLSVLAHGNESTFANAQQWVDRNGSARPELRMWMLVVAQLAKQVLALAESADCPLKDVQRELLIPLELTITTSTIGPATLFRSVFWLLEHVRSNLGTGYA